MIPLLQRPLFVALVIIFTSCPGASAVIKHYVPPPLFLGSNIMSSTSINDEVVVVMAIPSPVTSKLSCGDRPTICLTLLDHPEEAPCFSEYSGSPVGFTGIISEAITRGGLRQFEATCFKSDGTSGGVRFDVFNVNDGTIKHRFAAPSALSVPSIFLTSLPLGYITSSSQITFEYRILLPFNGFEFTNVKIRVQLTNGESFVLDVDDDIVYNGGLGTLTMFGVDPGTHTIDIRVLFFDGSVNSGVLEGSGVRGTFDRVLRAEEGGFNGGGRLMLSNPLSMTENPLGRVAKTTSCKNKIRLMFVGMLKFDGQKTIWLQQFSSLPKTRYELQYNTFLPLDQQDDAEYMTSALRDRGVQLRVRGLPRVSEGEVFESASEYGMDIDRLMKSNGGVEMDVIVDFLLLRLEEAGNDVSRVEPHWARKTWEDMTEEITRFRPDILVFANARESTDRLLTTACRLVSSRTKIVMELPNLFPRVKGGDVDVVIGPSEWAVQHWSVRGGEVGRITKEPAESAGKSDLEKGRDGGETSYHVIPPGVDTSLFSLEGSISCSSGENRNYTRQDFDGITATPFRCNTPHVKIGFVARISSEKSPGVFLRVAREVSKQNMFARFVVIGGGSMLADMKETAIAYGIDGVVTFLGAVYNEDLRSVMRGVDIIVNPSMRYESETFCIANIEAMSLGIPVVSFGIGGTGQYLRDGINSLVVYAEKESSLIGETAVKVMALIEDRELRRNIGREGIRTVMEGGFDVASFVKKYEELYSSLVDVD